MKVNRPKVKMFTGRVSKIKIGLMSALRKPSTRAAINADQKEEKCMPGTSEATNININVFRSQRSKIIV